MARKHNAKDRTISLFTGKTDIEDPVSGRDGSVGGEPRHERPAPPRDRGFHYTPGPVQQSSPLKGRKR